VILAIPTVCDTYAAGLATLGRVACAAVSMQPSKKIKIGKKLKSNFFFMVIGFL